MLAQSRNPQLRTPQQSPRKHFQLPSTAAYKKRAFPERHIAPCRIAWQHRAFHAPYAGFATQTEAEFPAAARQLKVRRRDRRCPTVSQHTGRNPNLPSAASADDVAVKCAKQARRRDSPASAPAFARNCRSWTKNSAAREGTPQFGNKSSVRKRTSPFGLERCSLDECVAICAGIPQLQAKVRRE